MPAIFAVLSQELISTVVTVNEINRTPRRYYGQEKNCRRIEIFEKGKERGVQVVNLNNSASIPGSFPVAHHNHLRKVTGVFKAPFPIGRHRPFGRERESTQENRAVELFEGQKLVTVVLLRVAFPGTQIC